jgi:hypothetical protein
MVRHVAHVDGTPSRTVSAAAATERHAWRGAARGVLRIAAIPLAALTAFVAGAVFVVLLPVCGIASIAEAMTRASWRFLSAAFGRNDAPARR